MWSSDQRNRLYLENEILHREGFTQFSIYWYKDTDTYKASGNTWSSSGKLCMAARSIPQVSRARKRFVSDARAVAAADTHY